MSTANIETPKVKNHIEIRQELQNGTTIEYVVIDGAKVGILGSLNEKDRAAAINLLEKAYNETGGNIGAMIATLSNIANDTEKGVTPDEIISVDGIEIEIEYSSGKALLVGGDEIANCDDLDVSSLPNEAIKALLEARVKTYIAEKRAEEAQYEEEYDDDDDDYNYVIADIII